MRWEDDEKYDKYHLDAYVRAPGGENNVDLQRRVIPYFRKKVMNAKEEKVVVVSHHGPLGSSPAACWACPFPTGAGCGWATAGFA